jgi:hypothetical protein
MTIDCIAFGSSAGAEPIIKQNTSIDARKAMIDNSFIQPSI